MALAMYLQQNECNWSTKLPTINFCPRRCAAGPVNNADTDHVFREAEVEGSSAVIRILVIGNNTADHFFFSNEEIVQDGKVQAHAYRCIPGGQATNAAVAFAGLGAEVYYAGMFGDNVDGVIARKSLEEAGVDIGYSRTVCNCANHVAAVFVNSLQGTRTIAMYKDPRLAAPPDLIDADLCASVDLVYTDNHEPIAAFAAAEICRTKNIAMLVDCEAVTIDTLSVVRLASSVILPVAVCRRLGESAILGHALENVRRMGPSVVIATQGAEGATGINDVDGIVSVPAAPCDLADTTGAGDAFHAGYAIGVLLGMDFTQSMQFACRVAAKKCGYVGPRLPPHALRELAGDIDRAKFRAPRL
jgi:sulfofructose kinase